MSDLGTLAGDLLDIVRESLIICDLDGRIVGWNTASEKLYGWPRHEAQGRLIGEILGPEQWPSSDQVEALKAGAGDLHRRSVNGDPIIVSAERVLRHNEAGAPWRVVETGIDVTAQRWAEVEAAAGERHYRNMFQAIPASVWDIDFSQGQAIAKRWLRENGASAREWFSARPQDARALMFSTYARDVNEQALALFGPCAREDLLVDIARYWPESSTADFAEWMIATLEGQAYFSCETRLRRYDGSEFDALFTASFSPGTVERGRLVVSIVDYSDVKRGQAAVRESEAFYTDMFHGSAFSAWHMDATEAWAMFHDLYSRGVTDFRAHVAQNPGFIEAVMDGIRVVDVNDTTLQLFGATNRSQIVGGSILPFWFPDRRDTLIGSLEAAYNGIPTYRGLARMRTLQGGEIEVLFTRSASTALSSRGQVLLAIVDMTDKVRAQAALAEMQANFAHAARIASLGELTASIAHEVNQPLAAISANGEAALQWLQQPGPDWDRLRGLAQDIIADARRASDVVVHVRSLASPQVGAHRRLSLSDLVGDALALLSSQMDRDGAVAVCDLQADLPEILGDPVQLQQVVVNLLMNALQALGGKPGSRVWLRTACVEDHVVLAIEDNGPGIAPESLERLFTSFFTTKPEGMGIGLAICRTIAQAHGGDILAENRPQGGAGFRVRLPCAPRAVEAEREKASAA